MNPNSIRPLALAAGTLTLVVGLAGCGTSAGGSGGAQSSPTTIPTSSTPDSTSSSPSASTSTGQTILTMSVEGCDACTISAIQVGPKGQYFQTPFVAAGRVNGTQLTLAVPTDYTKGMYFTATCQTGKCNSHNAQPVVVLRYPDQAVGASVSDSVAADEQTGSMCWAGTSEPSVTLAMTTTTFADKDTAGNPMTSMRIWASPQIGVVPGTDSTTFHGGLGAQGYLHC